MSEWYDAVQNAYIRGPREAFATLLQIAQDQTLKLAPEHHAWCLYRQGQFYFSGYQRDAALASYEQALDLFRQIGSKLGEANCYLAQGLVALEQEDYHNALALHSNAYQLYHQIQDGYSLTRLLYYRSFVYEAMEEKAPALQDVNEALIITQQLNLPFIDALQQRFDALQ